MNKKPAAGSNQTEAKRGFEVPMGRWLRTSLREIFEDMVLDKSAILGIGLNRQELQTLFDRHVNGQYDLGRGLWPLLSLALWVDKHYR